MTVFSRTLLASAAVSLLSSTALAQDVLRDDPPEGTPITGNELEVTGRTMEGGKHLVSVFGRYRYGVTDWFQAGTKAFEWLGGPNANIGFSPYASDKHAVSIEVDTFANYAFETNSVSANLIYSYGEKTGSRLNVGVAFNRQVIEGNITPKSSDPAFPDPPGLDLSTESLAIPLHIGYDWSFNDQQMLRVWFSPYAMYKVSQTENDVIEVDDSVPVLVFNSGIAYVRAYDKVRIIAGVAPTNVGIENLRLLEELALEYDGDPPMVWDVLPMPYFRLYWHF